MTDAPDCIMDGIMDLYFFFKNDATNLLFEGWDITTNHGFALTCLLFAFVAVVFEVIVSISTYLTRRFSTNPLEMDWSSSINGRDRSPLLAPLQIPSSVSKVTQRKFRIHFGRTIFHILSVVLGYILMLVVMTYNAYFLIAIVLGSSFGYLLFAPFRRPPMKKKKPVNRRAKRDELTRSGDMYLGEDRSCEIEGNENVI